MRLPHRHEMKIQFVLESVVIKFHLIVSGNGNAHGCTNASKTYKTALQCETKCAQLRLEAVEQRIGDDDNNESIASENQTWKMPSHHSNR